MSGTVRPLPHAADVAAGADGRLPLGDMFRYTAASTVILVLGLILGFRPAGGPVGVLAGMAVLVAFSFAFSRVWTMFGLLLRSEKSVMGVAMMVLFPLTFLSNILVRPETMPGWLQVFVDHNPVTHLVAVVRGLIRVAWAPS